MPRRGDDHESGPCADRPDAQVKAAKVFTLYASPITLGIGGLAGSLTGAAAAVYTTDPWIGAIGALISVTAALRMLHCTWVRRGVLSGGAFAEHCYEVGAWLFALLIGGLAAAAIVRGADPEIILLTVAVATGYAGGICARNAGRPAIAIGQLTLSVLPLTAALALSGTPLLGLLATLNVLFIMGMAQVTRQTFQAVSDAISASAAAEQRWLTTLDSLPQMVWVMRPDGGEEYYNRQWEQFAGIPLKAGGFQVADLLHPEDRQRVIQTWDECRRSGTLYEAEYRLRHKSGSYRWVLSRGQPERGKDGAILRWYGSCIDIHEHVIAQSALKNSEALNRGIVEASPDCISLLDPSGVVLYSNRAALLAYGVEHDRTLIGRPWGSRLDASLLEDRDAALAIAQSGGVGRLTLSLSQADGERWYESLVAPVSDASGEVIRLVVMSRDLTDQKRVEEQVRWTASHDHLTNLPNRRFFYGRLDEVISENSASGSNFALLLLDIDNFKQVNDVLGHDAGDALLALAAERLRACVRPDDTIARLGGDEFALILNNVVTEKSAQTVAIKILEQVSVPWDHEGRVMDCRLSMGVALFPRDAANGSELLKNADIALYSAKRSGRGKMAVFQSRMRSEMLSQTTMLNRARTALSNNWIKPFYQPKVDLRSGHIAGFEALLRWQTPTGGLQGAHTISAAFEDWSLSAELGDRIITSVLDDVEAWLHNQVPFGHVAINAAAAQLRRIDFAERLLERIRRKGIPTSCIQVEVTEGVFLGRGARQVEEALLLLSTNGISIALDDFGTGYASLSHLKRFPVSAIKIDCSFVRDLQIDPDDGAIVDALIGLGKSLNVDVIAEGIETTAQRDFLTALGCGYGQGFLFGKAVSAREATKLILKEPPRLAA